MENNNKVFNTELIKSFFPVLIAYLYFTGWCYAYFYYDGFGVNIYALDIPFYFFIVYSFPVIIDYLSILLIILIIFLIFLIKFLLKNNINAKLKLRNNINVIFIIVMIIIFPLLYYLSIPIAIRETEKIRLSAEDRGPGVALPGRIKFILKENKEKSDKSFTNLNYNNKLKLICITKDKFIVLYQPKGDGEVLPRGTVYLLDKSDVLFSQIEIQTVK